MSSVPVDIFYQLFEWLRTTPQHRPSTICVDVRSYTCRSSSQKPMSLVSSRLTYGVCVQGAGRGRLCWFIVHTPIKCCPIVSWRRGKQQHLHCCAATLFARHL